FHGDPLLQADINLAYSLDGVYRKGEFYLRWLQRVNSLFFATAAGRAVFLYLLLPFIGGFMVVIGGQEMYHIWGKVVRGATNLVVGKPAQATQQTTPTVTTQPVIVPPDGKVTADEVEGTDEEGDLIWEDAPHPAIIVQEVFLPTPIPAKEGHEFHVPWWWVG